MYQRSTTKKKIIAVVLTIILILQIGIVANNSFASDAELGDSNLVGTLGESLDVSSNMFLGASTYAAPVAGDVQVSITSNASGMGYQTYVDGYGAQPPRLATSLSVKVLPGGLLNPKVELDFASEKGYLDTFYFTYQGIDTISPSSIFKSVEVDSATGKVTVLLKDNISSGSSESINIYHVYNQAEYDGAAPSRSTLAGISAKAYVGSTLVYSTPVEEIKSQVNDYPTIRIDRFYPTVLGTAANPTKVFSDDVISVRQVVGLYEGRYRNKFDTASPPTVKVYMPNGSTGSAMVSNQTVAEDAVPGVPAGTYTIRTTALDAVLGVGLANSGWNINYDGNVNSNFSQADYSYILPPNSEGKTYPIYYVLAFKQLGSTETTYKSVVHYLKVEDTPRWDVTVPKSHGTGGSTTGDSPMEDDGVGKAPIRTGWAYGHSGTTRNQGNTVVLGTEKVLKQNGGPTTRANFNLIKFSMVRKSSDVEFPKVDYHIVVGSDKGAEDRDGGSGVIMTDSLDIPLPTLNDGEYIKSVHAIPRGKVNGTETPGAWPPGIGLIFLYQIKAWPGQTWPNGTTISKGNNPVAVNWTIKFNDANDNPIAGHPVAIDNAWIKYTSSSPIPEVSGMSIDNTDGSLKPMDTVKYRLAGYNTSRRATANWKRPIIIMRLPAGIQLLTSGNDMNGDPVTLKLKETDGTVLGDVQVVASGKVGDSYYYRLETPAGFEADFADMTPRFFIDMTLKIPAGIDEGAYQPEFMLTEFNSADFFTTDAMNGYPSGQTAAMYGLGDGEKVKYYKNTVQTSLKVIGSEKMSRSSMIKSNSTGGEWSSDSTVAAEHGEIVGVQLQVNNEGNKRLGGFKLYDVIPYGGYLNSSTPCNITLDSVVAPGNSKIYYRTKVGAQIVEDIKQVNPLDTASGWTETKPADMATVTAFYVDYGTKVLAGGETLTVELNFKIPALAPGELAKDHEQFAFNKFAYTAGSMVGTTHPADPTAYPSETQGFSTASFSIRYNKNHDGETNNWPDTQSGILMNNPATDKLTVTTQKPDRPGYIFKEWNDKANGTGNEWVLGATKAFTTNDRVLNLYDIWTINTAETIAVTFNLNGGNIGGGTVNPSVIGKMVEDTVAIPQAPTRNGYIFGGWIDNTSGSDEFWGMTSKIQSRHIANNGLTLKAKWNRDTSQKLVVSYKTVDGSNVTGMPANVVAVVGDVLTVPIVPVRPGYTFVQWNYGSAAWNFATSIDSIHYSGTAPNYTMELNAVWKISDGTGGTINEDINVTFDLGGGKIGTSTASVVRSNVHVEDKPALPTQPTKEGHTFTKWWEKIGTVSESEWTTNSQVTSAHMKAGSFTVTAKWTVNPYKVTYVTGGGTPATIPQVDRPFGTTYQLPNIIKNGHTFDGWFNSGNQNVGLVGANYTITAKDETLTARWTPIPYTLTFNSNGGTAPSPATITQNYGVKAGTLPVVTLTGYTFGGWINEAGTTIDSNYVVKKAETITARWTINPYTITFDVLSIGTAPASVTENFGTDITLPNMSVYGYTFGGWYDGATPAGTGGDTYKIQSNKTLKAKWTPLKYTITFNPNEGTTTPTPIIKDYPQVIGTLPTITRPGYDFTGWYNASGAKLTATYKVEKDEEVTARWTPQTYLITFDKNGGTTDGSKTTENIVFDTNIPELPSTIAGNAPTKFGYIFRGWSTDPGASNTANFLAGNKYTIANSEKKLTVYAVWDQDSYTLYLNSNKGTESTATERGVNVGTVVTLPVEGEASAPQKTGYALAGWSDTQGGGVNYAVGTYAHNQESNKILYAVWTAKTYTVYFDKNSGHTEANPTFLSVVFDGAIPALPTTAAGTAPTKIGYKFMGWSTTSGESNAANFSTGDQFTIDAPAGNLTVYAVWEQVKYNFKLNNNGGTGADESTVKVVYGQVVDLPVNKAVVAPSRTGYTLLGWDKSSMANPPTYTNLYTHLEEANVQLHAIWNQDHYNLNLNPNGGVLGGAGIVDVVYDQVVTLPALGDADAPTRTGYTFMGWASSQDAAAPTYSANKYTHKAETAITAYAVWQINTYQITVETWQYNYNQVATDAVATGTITLPAIFGTTFTAEVGAIPEYEFIDIASSAITISPVTGDATIKLYYKHVTYELGYDKFVELDVNDRYPAKSNIVTQDELIQIANVRTNSVVRGSRAIAGNPIITQSGLSTLDYSTIKDSADQNVILTFTWDSGQVESIEFNIKMSDRVAPIIEMNDAQRFVFNSKDKAPANEAELIQLLKNHGLKITDNYDGEIEPILSYADGSFNKINWKIAAEYGIFIDAADSSGNGAEKQRAAALIWVENNGSTGESGTNKPDPEPNVPGGNGSGNGSGTGTGNNGNNSSGSGNSGSGSSSNDGSVLKAENLPEGSYINKDGQLISKDGEVLSLNDFTTGKLPKTGAVVAGRISLGAIVALLLALIPVLKRKKKKRDEHQL